MIINSMFVGSSTCMHRVLANKSYERIADVRWQKNNNKKFFSGSTQNKNKKLASFTLNRIRKNQHKDEIVIVQSGAKKEDIQVCENVMLPIRSMSSVCKLASKNNMAALSLLTVLIMAVGAAKAEPVCPTTTMRCANVIGGPFAGRMAHIDGTAEELWRIDDIETYPEYTYQPIYEYLSKPHPCEGQVYCGRFVGPSGVLHCFHESWLQELNEAECKKAEEAISESMKSRSESQFNVISLLLKFLGGR